MIVFEGAAQRTHFVGLTQAEWLRGMEYLTVEPLSYEYDDLDQTHLSLVNATADEKVAFKVALEAEPVE